MEQTKQTKLLKKWQVFTICTLSAVAVGELIAIACLASRNHNFYDLRLTQDSEQELFSGLITNSSYTVAGEIVSNDKNCNAKTSSWNLRLLNNPSGVRVIHNSRKKNVFELDIKQPKSFVNGKSYVDAELSCKINNKTLKHDFAFDIWSNDLVYTANTKLIITNDGTTTTNEYKDVAIGSIGNKPIYQFEASNLKEEGTSLSDWTVVYKSSNENVVRLVPNTDPKKVNLQIVDKGSSIVSVDYFDALGTKVIHISKHWNLDDSDLLDASVFTNKILDSNNFGTENMGMYHIVRKTDTALISILDINGIGTTWDTPFVQNWNIGFESNNTNANIVTSQWLTKHEIGFNCSSFTAGMWVWLNATTPGGIKYVLTDADVNAPNDGGWQVYDS